MLQKLLAKFALATIVLICCDQFKYLSMITPIYLTWSDRGIEMSYKQQDDDTPLCLLVILRNSVFCGLNVICQSSTHFITVFKSL